MTSSFNFDQYLMDEPSTLVQQDQAPSKVSGFNFDQYAIDEGPGPQTFEQELVGGLKRAPARIAEQAFGLVGNVQELLESGQEAVLNLVESVTGESKVARTIIRGPREFGLQVEAPRSEDIRSGIKAIAGEQFEPESEMGQRIDNIVEDATSLLLSPGGKTSLVRALATSVAGNFGSEAVKAAGVGETGQNLAKLGIFTVSNLIRPGVGEKAAIEKFKQRDALVPKDAKSGTKNTLAAVKEIGRDIKGFETPADKFIKPKLKEARFLTAKGPANVKDLIDQKVKLNQIKASKGLFEELGRDKKELRQVQKTINKLIAGIEKDIEVYGKSPAADPNFLPLHKDASQMWAGLQSSNFVQNIVKTEKDLIQKFGISPKVAALFGAAVAPKAVAANVALQGLGDSMSTMKLFATNPPLRKLYLNVINQAMKGNSVPAIKAMSKLDKEMKKQGLLDDQP